VAQPMLAVADLAKEAQQQSWLPEARSIEHEHRRWVVRWSWA